MYGQRIMEICKAPTLRLKALNKHTHIMYIEMENVILKKEEEKKKKISARVFKHYARDYLLILICRGHLFFFFFFFSSHFLNLNFAYLYI